MFLPKHPLIKVTMFVLMIDKIEGFVTYFSSHIHLI